MAKELRTTPDDRLNGMIRVAVERLAALAVKRGHSAINVPVLFTKPDGSTDQLWFELSRHVGHKALMWDVVVKPSEHSRGGAFIGVAPLAWRVLFAKDGVKALAEALELVAAGNDLRVDQAVDALNEWLRVADPEGV